MALGRRQLVAGAALLSILLTVGACDGDGAGRTDPDAEHPRSTEPATDGQQLIWKEDLSRIWPLTVPDGTIECRQTAQAVFTAPDDTTYALNDRAQHAGYPSIDPLRAKNADGDKISLGALRSKAMSLCSASEP